MKKICLAMAAAAAIASAAMADNQAFHLANTLKFGYDDNLYLRDTDKQESFRIIDEVDVRLNLNMERTYLGIRYRPAVSWYAERENDKTDILHNLTFNWIQDLAPRLKLDVSDSLRAGDLPELYDDDGYVVRQDNDNYYNTARAGLLYQLTEKTRVDLTGRYMLLRYSDDDEDAHRYDNYDSWVAGLTLRQVLASRTTAMADFRFQEMKYEHSQETFNRDAQMIFAGLGLEQTFSREVIGSLRGGVEQRSYESDDVYDDQTKPYVEASLTLMPSPATRFTLTGSYSISESDISNYLSQERMYCSISAAHDFGSRLSAYLSASYAHGKYDGKYSSQSLPDVEEDSYTAGVRIAYKVLENNWIELGYHFLKLESDSDARESYADNRFDLGWKWQIK